MLGHFFLGAVLAVVGLLLDLSVPWIFTGIIVGSCSCSLIGQLLK